MTEPCLERLALLVGDEGIEKLSDSCVCILGLGGVGGSAALALARSGVGHLVVVDGDVVDETNLNRQAIALRSVAGLPKVEVFAGLVADINPTIKVTPFQRRLTPADIEAAIPAAVDYVIDCIDDIPVKIALAARCEEQGIPLVSSMGTARKWRPELLCFADISKTSVCPVCKIMRRELRARGVKHLQVLFSTEEPAELKGDNPRALGSNAFVPPVAGTMLAGFVTRRLLGID